MVFVGYGLQDKSQGIDDFAGLDLKGKYAVILSGAPDTLNSEVAAHLARNSKPIAAQAAGAIGLITVRTLKEAARQSWDKSVSRARLPRRLLLNAGGSGNTPVRSMVRTLAEQWYDGEIAVLHYVRSLEDSCYRDHLAMLPDIITKLIAAVADIIVAIVKAIPLLISAILEALPEIIIAIIDALVEAIPLIASSIMKEADSITTAIAVAPA
jgi:hypothetical protein